MHEESKEKYLLDSCKLVLFRLCEVFFHSHLKCVFLGGAWECVTKLLAWLSQGSSWCCAATENVNVVEEEAALLSSCNRHSCRRSETSWLHLTWFRCRKHIWFSIWFNLETHVLPMLGLGVLWCKSFCKMPMCCCLENYQERRSKCCLGSPMREGHLSCHLMWLGLVPGNLSAPGTQIPPSVWFGWYHLASPHSNIV